MPIYVANPGITTVQDLGRYGYGHLGVSPAGAADQLSSRIANLLVGNDENAPALEMTLLGATLQFEEAAIVAIVGAECKPTLGNQRLACGEALHVPQGAVLQCGGMIDGARAYLAVQGGWSVPLVMGSASTDLGGQFGGVEGRLLKRGDRLSVRPASGLQIRRLRDELRLFEATQPKVLRVTRGAQQGWFAPEAFHALFSTTFTVTERAGRTGLRLNGEHIFPTDRSELLTDGTPLGAIQIPPDGQPIILFVDQQTTGGYPKIANVIAVDMHCVGQLRPQDEVTFSEVSIPEAIRLLRQQELWLKDIFVGDPS